MPWAVFDAPAPSEDCPHCDVKVDAGILRAQPLKVGAVPSGGTGAGTQVWRFRGAWSWAGKYVPVLWGSAFASLGRVHGIGFVGCLVLQMASCCVLLRLAFSFWVQATPPQPSE
jgi:hypothetical protein